MAESCNAENGSQNVNGAVPGQQDPKTSPLKINYDANAQSIFNPNNALSGVNTFLALNAVVNQMFGIEARWFRSVPQQRSKDVIFQEYTLSCVEEKPHCIKVLLPDGNFPDSQYQFDLMGLEYDTPLTIHIDKKYWEQEVGFGTAPQKKDIVYLPLPNKLYQVESSFLDRAFMEQETTWNVNLIKYQPEASRREPAALQETIDNYTVSEEELFGPAIQDDIEKLVDDQQFSPERATSEDKYKSYDSALKVLPGQININGVMVADSYYDLNTSDLYNAVRYKFGDEIDPKCDRALTCWVQPRAYTGKKFNVTWIQKDLTITPPANYKIKIKTSTRFEIGDTMVISRPGALNFYATVIDDTYANDSIYYCQIDDEVENYLNSVNSNWTNAKGYTVYKKDPITLIDGRNTTSTGFRILMYANQYIKIIYGSQTHIAAITDRLKDNNWYGIIANIGNSWGQYNVYVWEILSDNSDIRVKFFDTMRFTPEYTEIEEYTLDKSDAYLTNIRIYKTTIEEEKQANELLSYFSQDADQAVLLDNADPRYTAPYVSQQR